LLLARYPGLKIELVMRDQLGDMVEDRLDLEWRSGEIADASLVARRVGESGRAVVAAPIYLERYAVPLVPDDLTAHACVIHSSMPDPNTWRFTGPEGPLAVCVNGAFSANDSAAVHRAVRGGHGIALLLEIEVVDDLQAGRLLPVVEGLPVADSSIRRAAISPLVRVSSWIL
jgi:DNA-binding transcriptional LysR family regulator